ncbi:hypothetical protein OW495_03125 [Vibrio sp. 14N.309.X.WAT.E.F5]|uniref:hypothetical protein n=1 Tax=Vibrio TaxID=662 RepID=UPI001E62C029|nr:MULTISPECIES: hypothetical protein [Vibrio]MCC4784491.1 hypothetical protein [Vibrio lentus]MDN2665691.1 hypothetical protein [Vibrio sp. 14N.309.X.WAT.E.F5]
MYTKKESTQEVSISLDNLHERFNFEIKYLKEYLNFSKESVEERSAKLADRIYADSLENPDLETMLQEMYEKEHKAISSYLYHSSIVLVYTVLESTLAQICTELKFTARIPFSFDEVSGAGNIMKAFNYLKMVSSLPKVEIERITPKFGKYQQLRNSIAHKNGRFSGKNEAAIQKQRREFVAEFSDLELSADEMQFFIMSSETVDKFILLVEKTIDIVVSHIKKQAFVVAI